MNETVEAAMTWGEVGGVLFLCFLGIAAVVGFFVFLAKFPPDVLR